jgi:hypothetical protein
MWCQIKCFVDSQIRRDRDRRCENSRRPESEMIVAIDRKEGRGLLILAPLEFMIQSSGCESWLSGKEPKPEA